MGYAAPPAATQGSGFYVLRFTSARNFRTEVFAAWSIAGPTTLRFDAEDGRFALTDMLGRSHNEARAINGSLTLANVTDAPIYAERISASERTVTDILI